MSKYYHKEQTNTTLKDIKSAVLFTALIQHTDRLPDAYTD